jgi:hypothetical protein
MIRDIYPGIFIHSVFIEQAQDKDKRAGFVRTYLLFIHSLISS